MLARPPIWRFTVFGREIRPSVCPFDHGSAMAAEIASRSPATPRAKAPTGEDKAVCSQVASRADSRPRIRAWKPSTASRAATRRGTARSTVAVGMHGEAARDLVGIERQRRAVERRGE